VKIRWARILLWAIASIVLAIALAIGAVWLKLRGTPVNAAIVDPANVSTGATTPQVMRIWPGKPPGSENWTQREVEVEINGEQFVRNVTDPTITAYFPPAGKANGAAMIVCPGGGFHMLTMKSEGEEVARDLNSLGIAAFILRYRLTETNAAFLTVMAQRLRTPGGMKPILDQMTPLIEADGGQAIRVVRTHAAQWGLDARRIGMIGFSAGGYLALNVTLHPSADAAPDFVAAIYPLAPTPLTAPPAKTPLFLLAADDDPLVPPTDNSMRLYQTWHHAGIPAELHIYAKGGHGFGMRKQGLPIDAWPDALHGWLKIEGVLEAARENPGAQK
jgi:acetyl esterase/lipase